MAEHGDPAPRSNSNALKSGLYTAESLELRRLITRLVRDSRKIIEKMCRRAWAWSGRVVSWRRLIHAGRHLMSRRLPVAVP